MPEITEADTLLDGLQRALAEAEPADDAATLLQTLIQAGLDRLPLPGGGATLQRWKALALVAGHDLSLAKLYEGHTDARAILHEFDERDALFSGARWGVWASESAQGRVTLHKGESGRVRLYGTKCWCSGADSLSHALLTAWHADGTGPQLVRVALNQGAIQVFAQAWKAVGMQGSAGVDVFFDGAMADAVGASGHYLQRPGFWHGGAGVAACWWGGARALAEPLFRKMQAGQAPYDPLRLAALGTVDLALRSAALALKSAARWIDEHPLDDAGNVALRARLAVEASADTVLREAGRALGAPAFCRDARFARMAADLPVFLRQSHADHDIAQLGRRVLDAGDAPWTL
ncbi:MAG: acyl-CoA dehydrogenase [Burkholderiaceae bacterium]